MPRRPSDTTAAALLGTWTDSDTAMQIVGTSLGIFGLDLLNPELALSHETPLRNALFDVLLSLVEGGALDMRPTDDGLYAFRWRPDYAVAGLTSETSSAIDVAPPSPYLAELTQLRRERDDALGRAQFAEALATERERLLRMADIPTTKRRAAPRRAAPRVRDTPDGRDRSAPDALSASSHADDQPTRDEIDIRDDVPKYDAIVFDEPGTEAPEEPRAAVSPKPPTTGRVTKPRAKPKTSVDASKPSKAKARTAKATKATRAPKPKPVEAVDVARVDAEVNDPNVYEPNVYEPNVYEPNVYEPTAEETDVVYLTPSSPETESDATAENDMGDELDDESIPRRAKWSGYTLDKPRLHLSSVDRLADEG
jgi:hypothetical protein